MPRGRGGRRWTGCSGGRSGRARRGLSARARWARAWFAAGRDRRAAAGGCSGERSSLCGRELPRTGERLRAGASAAAKLLRAGASAAAKLLRAGASAAAEPVRAGASASVRATAGGCSRERPGGGFERPSSGTCSVSAPLCRPQGRSKSSRYVGRVPASLAYRRFEAYTRRRRTFRGRLVGRVPVPLACGDSARTHGDDQTRRGANPTTSARGPTLPALLRRFPPIPGRRRSAARGRSRTRSGRADAAAQQPRKLPPPPATASAAAPRTAA